MAHRWLVLVPWLAAALANADTRGISVPHDDVKGRALDFVTHQIRPLAMSSDGAHLYVLNQPGSRLAIFQHPGLTPVAEIPVGPGLVGVVERVPQQELWLVDSVQHSIVIVDPTRQLILDTIRVGAEPHGLVFTPDNSRAYVACSAEHRIDVIDAIERRVVKSIPVPAMNPRALEWLDGRLWVASFRSGNNTAPMGADAGDGVNRIVRVRDLDDFPTLNQLPDRDVFSITPQPDAADDALDIEVYSGIGTMLLDLAARPGTTELWVANTEALNAVYRGERAFIEGQVVSNRVTILDVSGGAATVVDLDALAPEDAECAQPTGISFAPDGSRAFVSGYNSDRVAVLDIDAGGQVSWAGHIDVLPGQTYPEGAGPRSTVLSLDATTLYVFSKIDNGVIAVPLEELPTAAPFEFLADLPIDIGFTPVSGRELRGRFLFVNAKFSKSGTSSCASCHVDATNDGMVWDLSGFLDPEGTDNEALAFGVDVKGPLVTQNTLRLAETSPFHWRGEKAGLLEFNAAFPNLLENEEDGEPSNIGGHFQYVASYMRHLPIAANPRQELDRSLTAQQARGAHLFQTAPSFRGKACGDCHALPLGTSGELVGFKIGGSSKTGVVPSLRGVADKLAPPFTIGGEFGERTELGAGLLHGGAVGGLDELLALDDPDNPGQPLFHLSPAEAADLVAYLEAFDTGLAPATTMQVTATAANWAGDARATLRQLIEQAEAGHCDLICRRSPVPGPPLAHRSYLYDPEAAEFLPAERGGAAVTADALLLEARDGSPVTFLGVPGHSGLQMALDRDVDGLWDLDELSAGTHPEEWDHDGDGFPDGYELEWGLDPTQADASSPDDVPPKIVGTPRRVYQTGTAIKVEYETDEMVRALVRVDGAGVIRQPFGHGFDREFSLVLGELKPGRTYEVEIELEDPAENIERFTFHWSTRPNRFDEPVRVTAIRPTIVPAVGGGRPHLWLGVQLQQGNAAPVPGYAVTASVYHRLDADGSLTMIEPAMRQVLGGARGRMVLETELPHPAELGGPGVIIITVQDIDSPPGGEPYVEALDEVGVVELTY